MHMNTIGLRISTDFKEDAVGFEIAGRSLSLRNVVGTYREIEYKCVMYACSPESDHRVGTGIPCCIVINKAVSDMTVLDNHYRRQVKRMINRFDRKPGINYTIAKVIKLVQLELISVKIIRYCGRRIRLCCVATGFTRGLAACCRIT